MKKIIVFILSLSALPVSAEIVSQIGFNPSRLGEYQFLKIVKDANLRGGLLTKELDINGKETVTINVSTSSNQQQSITAKHIQRDVVLENGGSEPVYPMNININFPNAGLQNTNRSDRRLPTIKLGGGQLVVKNSSVCFKLNTCSGTSSGFNRVCGRTSCEGLNSSTDKMDFSIGKLQRSGTLEIQGAQEGGTWGVVNIPIVQRKEDDPSTVRGFMLAGNEIPDFRNGAYVQRCLNETFCTTGGPGLSSGNLKFVERKDHGGNKVKVLAFVTE